jgi:hypothetical protein
MIKSQKYQRMCPARNRFAIVELAYTTDHPKSISFCVTKPISYFCSERAIAEYPECEQCAPHIPDIEGEDEP